MNDIEHILFCMQFASLTAQQTGRLRGTILNIGDWRESPNDDTGMSVFCKVFPFPFCSQNSFIARPRPFN